MTEAGTGGTITGKHKTPYDPKNFDKAAPKQFRETFHAAKATVAPKDAWRVDDTYSDTDYEEMDCFTTKGGSSIAVHDGDIVSVCKSAADTTCTGSNLLEHAVKMGGRKLDAFSGLYGFYTKNGFEPVSWCSFDEQYAPHDWDKGRDNPEPVIFFRYTGASQKEIAAKYGGTDSQAFLSTVKASSDYGAAMEMRNKALEGKK